MAINVRVLSLRSGIIHGFVTEPRHSRHVVFHVSVRLRGCSNHALSCLRALFRVGAWCSDPGTHVLSLGFVNGFGHLCSMFCLVMWVCGLEFARPCTLLSTCFVLHTVRGIIGCVHSCYVLCCVARSLCFSLAACFYVVMSCVNTWLMSILISCVFVSCFSHGLWFCFSGHVLLFLFCVSTWLLS